MDEQAQTIPQALAAGAQTPPPAQRPSIGRIVHYHMQRGIMPAIITAVHNDTCVNLTIFVDAESIEIRTSATLGDELEQWKWPARV
jgi:hypothetical protein